jgi:hypothetical protein
MGTNNYACPVLVGLGCRARLGGARDDWGRRPFHEDSTIKSLIGRGDVRSSGSCRPGPCCTCQHNAALRGMLTLLVESIRCEEKENWMSADTTTSCSFIYDHKGNLCPVCIDDLQHRIESPTELVGLVPCGVWVALPINGPVGRALSEDQVRDWCLAAHKLVPAPLRDKYLRSGAPTTTTPAPNQPRGAIPERAADGKPIYYICSAGVANAGDPDSGFHLVRLDPAGLSPATLGQVIDILRLIDNTAAANRQNAERAGGRWGEQARLQGHFSVDVNRSQCIDRILGIGGVDELRMLCELVQRPFSAPSLSSLRSELCVADRLSLAQADALPIPQAAARMRALKKTGGRMLTVDDISEFSKVRGLSRSAISDTALDGIRDLDERTEIEPWLREILRDPTQTPHNSAEIADILTSAVSYHGGRRLAAFVNKGKAYRRVRAKDATHQIVRLRQIEGLACIVLLAVGDIQDDIKRDFLQVAADGKYDYLIVDCVDVARLFVAYHKVCPIHGSPLTKGSCGKCSVDEASP